MQRIAMDKLDAAVRTKALCTDAPGFGKAESDLFKQCHAMRR